MTLVPVEFSRPVLADVIPTRGIDVEFEATPDECAALAHRFGIVSVHFLKVSARLKAIAGGTLFRLDGKITARATQTCVVTLDPVDEDVNDEFHLVYGAVEDDGKGELEFSMDDDDPPEPLVDGAVDVGEAAAEHMALALDPFPRKPGAELPPTDDFPATPEVKKNPFGALAALQQKKQ